MSQHKYPLRRDPKQTFGADDWELVQNKKGSKNTRKQQKKDNIKVRNEIDTGDNLLKPKFKFPCEGCEVVVQNNEALRHHQATCQKLQVDSSKPTSFLGQTRKLVPAEVSTSPTKDKNIVLTQPMGSQSYAAMVSSPAPGNPTTATSTTRDDSVVSHVVREEVETTVNFLVDETDSAVLIDHGTGVQGAAAVSNTHGNPAQTLYGDEDDDTCCCPLCKEKVLDDQEGVECEMCLQWSHKICLCMTDEEYNGIKHNPATNWFCARCLAIKANKISWGIYEGEEMISRKIKSIYDTILSWSKNTFSLPRGNCGNDFIKELTRLINLFVRRTEWERLALCLVHIFIPIMLQNPNKKSKPRDHTKYLTSRLERWKKGELESLMAEVNEIQARINKSNNSEKTKKKEESREKAFVRLVMFGKLGPAAKYINNEDSVKGVHSLTNEIKEILQGKHPAGMDADPEVILEYTAEEPQPVIFEEITSDNVYRMAKRMSGSGGPTLIDSDSWKHFLCSKTFGKSSVELCQAVADLAKHMCTVEVHPDNLVEYNASRLIPLDKGLTKDQTPGVRPIGVGEVLRRIVGKMLISVIKDDIIDAVGPLQTCSGLRGGIEAAIHAMRKTYSNEETEAIMLVDAENAFNKLNRKTALQIIFRVPSYMTSLVR